MTYTHKLDNDKCACATKDMKDLHTFLYYYSYLFYILYLNLYLLLFHRLCRGPVPYVRGK